MKKIKEKRCPRNKRRCQICVSIKGFNHLYENILKILYINRSTTISSHEIKKIYFPTEHEKCIEEALKYLMGTGKIDYITNKEGIKWKIKNISIPVNVDVTGMSDEDVEDIKNNIQLIIRRYKKYNEIAKIVNQNKGIL